MKCINKFQTKLPRVLDSFYHYDFQIRLHRLRSGLIFNENFIVVTDVVSDVTYSRKSVNTRMVITRFIK